MSGTASAPARPETDAGSDGEPPDADGWALLDSLRRRLDDQGSQTRKTAAQVQQLADSIGALVAAQRRRTRWLNINSFVAYVMFTLLCGVAFYFLYQSRARELVSARDRVTTERDQAVRRGDELAASAKARDATDAKALDAWTLLEAGKRDDAAKKLAELATAPMPKVLRQMLAARAKQAELVEVDAALKAAGVSVKAGRFPEAAATLEAALKLQGADARAGDLHYQLAQTQLKLGAIDKAAVQFQAAVTADVTEEDARFQLASAQDRLGQWAKARAEYDRFATAHPQSAFAPYALHRSATLAHMPAQGPWVAPVAPKPAEAGSAAPAAAEPTTP